MEKRDPCTLLVGLKTVAGTMENSMEVSQKAKNRFCKNLKIPYDPSTTLLGTYLGKKIKTLIQKDT